jgi:DedD protein
MAEEQQDVETLKRRGRRRLVGAVALVLLAVIVLPMVFDPEPKSTVAPVEVRIPSESESTFAPPKPPAKAAPKAETPARQERAPAKQEAKPATPAAQAAGEYVIQVGAFSRPESVIAKLAAAKLPYYTEPMQGNLTRVRAGPFPSREAADQALTKLKALGLKPGAVTTRSE